jgi:hypothetical protein
VGALTEVTYFEQGIIKCGYPILGGGCLSVAHRYTKNHIPALGFFFIALTLITSYIAYSHLLFLEILLSTLFPLFFLLHLFLLDVPTTSPY